MKRQFDRIYYNDGTRDIELSRSDESIELKHKDPTAQYYTLVLTLSVAEARMLTKSLADMVGMTVCEGDK